MMVAMALASTCVRACACTTQVHACWHAAVPRSRSGQGVKTPQGVCVRLYMWCRAVACCPGGLSNCALDPTPAASSLQPTLAVQCSSLLLCPLPLPDPPTRPHLLIPKAACGVGVTPSPPPLALTRPIHLPTHPPAPAHVDGGLRVQWVGLQQGGIRGQRQPRRVQPSVARRGRGRAPARAAAVVAVRRRRRHLQAWRRTRRAMPLHIECWRGPCSCHHTSTDPPHRRGGGAFCFAPPPPPLPPHRAHPPPSMCNPPPPHTHTPGTHLQEERLARSSRGPACMRARTHAKQCARLRRVRAGGQPVQDRGMRGRFVQQLLGGGMQGRPSALH